MLRGLTNLITITLCLTFIPSAQSYQSISSESITFQVSEISIEKTLTLDGAPRGPALGVLADGSLLLGGGDSGGSIFLMNPTLNSIKEVGRLIPNNRREKDSRFAITDIAVLSENVSSARLLISYPRLGTDKVCVEVVVEAVTLDRRLKKISHRRTWFISKPCVPISSVQHASGRIEPFNKSSAYVTIGDLGYSQINNRSKRGDLGSIFRISATSVVKVSQGHRNTQGIVLYKKQYLLASEHGPRGGDELNLIKPGKDYGWPFVTYGQPYGDDDYVRPLKVETHEGYRKPLTYWVPSIAPTGLVELPLTPEWGEWAGQLAMGTLAEKSLVLIALDKNLKVIKSEIIFIGERMRDLDLDFSGRLVVTTDSGKLLRIYPK